GNDWRFLGQAAADQLATNISDVSLTTDSQGHPSVVASGGSSLEVRRYNASPKLPAALNGRGDRGDCAIPADGAAFPQNLTASGRCLIVAGRWLVTAAIPYSLISGLWRDDAKKRRYLLSPGDATVGYSPIGALSMPLGKIIIKECWFEKPA